ncbi:MAG: DNA repair protein RecN [Actinobacteria bacterium]|nr:DNA repair protein RecN [Actinomycetota bacterium]
MLLELRIKDLALIDEVSVEFGPGLNVLTGETGAGKTVVVEAINLLTGGRADSALVRSGAEKSRVEGRFSLVSTLLRGELADFADGGELVVARVLGKDGKNRCYLNGSPVTVGQLSSLGATLIDLHGQHDQQSLFRTTSHLDFLDHFAGPTVLAMREKCGELVGRRRRIARDIERLTAEERDILAKKDLLEFQVAEIERANLEVGEEERLQEERELLRHLEKIFAAVDAADTAIAREREASSAIDRIAEALGAVKRVTDIDARLDELTDRLSSIYYELEEWAGEVKSYAEELTVSPGRLDEVEDRLAELALLKRKYGRDTDEVLSYKDKAKQELEVISNKDARKAELADEIAQVESELSKIAVELSTERKKAAFNFERAVAKELADLSMADARFRVELGWRESAEGLIVDGRMTAVDERGVDKVEFLISTNAGEAVKPLTKIASGGEISRAMLALKIVLSGADPVPTLIFDEIDAGIGGEVANGVGQKLRDLGGEHQVFVVTHLAQIARFADEHYRVTKGRAGGRTLTSVVRLDEESRVLEIARMLSGEMASEVALCHAAELLAVTGEAGEILSES